MHKCSILSVGNKRRLGSSCSFLSANGCVFLRICQSFAMPRNTAYNKQMCTVRNARQPPTFLTECFRILKSHSDCKWSISLFVPIVLWWLSLISERDRRSYHHDTASTSSTDTDPASPASSLLAGIACLPQTTNEALPFWPCCHRRARGGGNSGDEAVSGLHGLYGALSSSSLAAILRLPICELRNLHELSYHKNKARRLDTEVA